MALRLADDVERRRFLVEPRHHRRQGLLRGRVRAERVGGGEKEALEPVTGAPRWDTQCDRVFGGLLEVRELYLRVLRDAREDRVTAHALGHYDSARDQGLRVKQQRE